MKYKYFYFIIFLLFFNSLNAQFFDLGLRGTSILHQKPKADIIKNANLHGSFAESKGTLTYESSLESRFIFRNKYFVNAGLGIGYFNTSFRIKTTREFLNANLSDLAPLRFSYSLSRFFTFRTGFGKLLYNTDKSSIFLSFDGRVYYTEPGNSGFRVGSITSENGMTFYTYRSEEIINENRNLDFNIDANIQFQKQISNLPLYWSLGIGYSYALTELWQGTTTFTGDNESRIENTSNKLTFFGLSIGFVYRHKNNMKTQK